VLHNNGLERLVDEKHSSLLGQFIISIDWVLPYEQLTKSPAALLRMNVNILSPFKNDFKPLSPIHN
jgi:hypothetical protein